MSTCFCHARSRAPADQYLESISFTVDSEVDGQYCRQLQVVDRPRWLSDDVEGSIPFDWVNFYQTICYELFVMSDSDRSALSDVSVSLFAPGMYSWGR